MPKIESIIHHETVLDEFGKTLDYFPAIVIIMEDGDVFVGPIQCPPSAPALLVIFAGGNEVVAATSTHMHHWFIRLFLDNSHKLYPL